MAEINFIEGLSVSLEQSCLYEEETREQSDTQKWHDLRAQRLSSSKFKDVCIRRADFESLAVRQLKKTVQTSAMKHGINTEEEAASAYADSGDCNVRFDAEFCATMKMKLDTFYFEYLLPELLKKAGA